MSARSYIAASILCALSSSVMPAHAATACAAEGGAEFICGVSSPEDLIQVPQSSWVIISGMAEGASHLYIVDSNTKVASSLYPVASAPSRLDKKAYPTCPGPLPAGVFGAHGIDLRPKSAGIHTLFAVNHAGRESIEVFELDTSTGTPSVTWVGCAVLPPHSSGNGVVGLPAGGFITSNFKDPGDADAFKKMSAGQVTGNVLEWHAESGWTPLPGSAMSGANGLALSSDGKWLFVAGWPGKNVTRYERTGKTWAKRNSIATGFLTDNLRWLADGSLLAAGQDANMPAVFECRPPQCRVGSAAAKIDPRTMQVRRVVTYAGNGSFEGATTAIEVGNEFWLGSFKGDRVARLPR
ncbi:MAG: hypothetical protein ABI885_06320 [Gammaproteobacteria bacterium]